MSHKQRQERIQQYKARAEADVAHDRPKTTEEIDRRRYWKKQHRGDGADKGEDEK